MAETSKNPYPVDELIRAIRAEIKAELANDATGERKVSLTGGRRTGGTDESHEYVFATKTTKSPFNSPKVLVRQSTSRKPWETAEAAWMPDGKVRLTTTAELGAQPANTQIREDDTAGLNAMVERLERAGEKDGPVNLSTAGWILGQGRPATGSVRNVEALVRGYRELNLNTLQRQAIERALGSEITFVWGPPGTGKTEVVSRIVEGCFRQGLRVLFLAPTKVAVDQALERICELLAGEEHFDQGLVQRAGAVELASLSEKFGDAILPDRIAERLSAELTAQAVNYAGQLEKTRTFIGLYEQVRRLSTELDSFRTRAATAHATAATAQAEIDIRSARNIVTRSEIAAIGVPSGLFAQRKEAKLAALRQELAHDQGEASRLSQQVRTAQAERRLCLQELTSGEPTLAAAQARLAGVPDLSLLHTHEKAVQDRLTRIEGEQKRIGETVRTQCRVMGTTVAKAVQSRRLMDTIDVVIVDEAGMVDLPSAWCAAGLASKRVVLGGDFRQLPAVTKGSGDRTAGADARAHSQRWMDYDAFHAAGLVDERGGVRKDPRLVALNEQYRMRPAICAVVNEVAYPDAPLTTGRDDTSRLPASPLIEGPLILVDTTSARERLGMGGRQGAHKSNAVHEAIIHELIRGLQYDTVLPARKWSNLPEGDRPTDRMAVIAPYKDQVKALGKSLTYRFGETYEGLVDTVHRFQGSQRPLVVIDTVAGAGDRVGYFYEGTGLSSSTCRLLNVALSRAQDHLLVVADVDFLQRKLNPGSEAARMLNYLLQHAQRLPVDELVPVRMASDLAGLPDEQLVRPAFFPKDEVPKAVEWDIARAARSIEVYCAFLDRPPVAKWLRHLRPRIAQGVTVTVYTRDQEPGTTPAALVNELRAAGCQVITRERMHEKVLILDDTILWHGSLNLFANNGPTDLMMRITDPGSCERVRHIVAQARMERPARLPPWKTSNTAPASASPGDVINGRLYLAVPRQEKDEAKRLAQAKWDGKLWHVDANIRRDLISRWLPKD